jgi:hypothetical protein
MLQRCFGRCVRLGHSGQSCCERARLQRFMLGRRALGQLQCDSSETATLKCLNFKATTPLISRVLFTSCQRDRAREAACTDEQFLKRLRTEQHDRCESVSQAHKHTSFAAPLLGMAHNPAIRVERRE